MNSSSSTSPPKKRLAATKEKKWVWTPTDNGVLTIVLFAFGITSLDEAATASMREEIMELSEKLIFDN